MEPGSRWSKSTKSAATKIEFPRGEGRWPPRFGAGAFLFFAGERGRPARCVVRPARHTDSPARDKLTRDLQKTATMDVRPHSESWTPLSLFSCLQNSGHHSAGAVIQHLVQLWDQSGQ